MRLLMHNRRLRRRISAGSIRLGTLWLLSLANLTASLLLIKLDATAHKSHPGRKFEISHKPISEVQKVIDDNEAEQSVPNAAYMDEWNYSGASAPPKDKLFTGIRLRKVVDLLGQVKEDRADNII